VLRTFWRGELDPTTSALGWVNKAHCTIPIIFFEPCYHIFLPSLSLSLADTHNTTSSRINEYVDLLENLDLNGRRIGHVRSLWWLRFSVPFLQCSAAIRSIGRHEESLVPSHLEDLKNISR